MRRLLLALLLASWSTLALAQGCGPTNPNCVVPDRPTGDVSNSAADTRFVSNPANITFLQNGAGAIPRSLNSWLLVNAVHSTDFSGPVNGATTTVNVTINSGSAALTVGSATFASTDCQGGAGCTGVNGNKAITINGAGTAGAPLVTTITSFISSTQVGLGLNAGTSLAAQPELILWGTDNTTGLQNWLNECAGVNVCYLDPGNYVISSAITSGQAPTIIGAGRHLSDLYLANPANGGISIATNTPLSAVHISSIGVFQFFTATDNLILLNGTSQNFGSTFDNLYLFGGATGISATNDQYFSLDDVIVINQSSSSLFYTYNLVCAAGVVKIQNSYFSPLSSGIDINMGSVGGVTIMNNVISASSGVGVAGINFASGQACAQSDIFIGYNNIEQQGIGINLTKGSSTTMNSVAIVGNDFAGDTSSAMNIGDSNSNWLFDVAISENMIYCSGTCVTVTNAARNVTIDDNTFAPTSGTPTGLNVSGNVATGIARNNTFRGMGTNVSNSSPLFAAETLVNGHLMTVGVAPTLTAGCNGAGSSVSGTDFDGTVTGQTAAATTCTLTFAQAFGSTPNCQATGISSPLTGAVTPSTTTLVVNFASTANYKFAYHCAGT